jgi:hypothetical protein
LKIFTPSQVASLLEEGYRLKRRLDEKIADDVYEPEFHIGRRLKEVLDELAEIQQSEGLERLTHGDITFRLKHVNPRMELDREEFIHQLQTRGVRDETIRAALKPSLKPIREYWTKELT